MTDTTPYLLTDVGGGYRSVSGLVAELLISRSEPVRAMIHHDDGRADALPEQRSPSPTTATGETTEQACQGLFCFIGAEPATSCLTEVAAATPLPFESNVPVVFAAGDVRVASLKRVASAIGEGAGALHPHRHRSSPMNNQHG
jgi:thioredoxin reductase